MNAEINANLLIYLNTLKRNFYEKHRLENFKSII